jgi:hypothetical protein
MTLQPFPTTIHRNAQLSNSNSVDAKIQQVYLPFQIEPGSEELYGSVEKAQQT